jgi:hypothetical protein
MKTISPPLAACVSLAVACLAWIGGVSWAMVHFLGLSSTLGWIIAGSLGFSLIAGLTLILYELNHAIDLRDYVDPEEFDGIALPKVKTPKVARSTVLRFQRRGQIC